MKFALNLVCITLVVTCVFGQLSLDQATLDNLDQYLDDPLLADQLLECIKDMGASSGTQCPAQLSRASELAVTLGMGSECPTCTPEEIATFGRFRDALILKPELLNKFVAAILPA